MCLDDIQLIIEKGPEKKDFLELLADYAYAWKELGEALGCREGFLSGLERKNSPDMGKLSDVYSHWKDTMCSPMTWKQVLEAVESKTFGEKKGLASEIRNKLSEDDYFKKYREC